MDFIKSINGVKLEKQPYPEQFEIIKAASKDVKDLKLIKYVTVSTGRQVGKSASGILISLIWAFSDSGCNILIVQPTIKQLKKLFRQFEKAVKPFNCKTNKTDLTISFPNGSFISMVSGESKDSVRGNSINYLWVDEAAFIQDDVFNGAIRPIVIAVGKVILLTSTPNGRGNFFYEIFHSDYSKSITFPSVTSPLIKQEDLDIARMSMPPDLYRQEYLAEFIEGRGTVFTNIDNCATIHEWIEPSPDRKYYAGIDWAKQIDKSVLTIIDDLGQVVYVQSINGIGYDEIINQFSVILKKYNPITGVETNGIGDPLFEQLQKVYGNIEAFNMSNSTKENIVTLAIKDFNTKSVKIPTKILCETLYNELMIFTFEYLPVTRTIRYTHPPGMHDDNVISFCIANHIRHKWSQSGNIKTYKPIYDEDNGFW